MNTAADNLLVRHYEDNSDIQVKTYYEQSEKTKALRMVRAEIVYKEDTVPLSQRRYINPKNGKEVGYARAKSLGLI